MNSNHFGRKSENTLGKYTLHGKSHLPGKVTITIDNVRCHSWQAGALKGAPKPHGEKPRIKNVA